MKIEIADINSIQPYINNPRKLKDSAIDKVAMSIKEYGFRQPIVVDANRIIVVGHTRYRASKKLGLKEVPITIAENLTQEQINAYRIADNRTNEEAEWDLELLKTEIKELELADFNLDLTGFDEDQLNDMLFEEKQGLTDEDETPEIDESKVKSKLGDLWLLGDHKLLCGDSLQENNYKLLLKNKIANISFTSPPYNAGSLNIQGNNRTKEKYKSFNDNMTLNEYDKFININLTYLLEYSEEVFYNIGLVQNNKKSIFNLIHSFNTKFKDIIYWKKSSVAPHIQKGIINNMVEFILAFGDGKRKFKNPQFTQGSYYNVIEGKNASNNEFSKIHKATFPVYLPENIIKNFTSINSIILDCFGGTGTTIIACEKLNRICYMIELDNLYTDTIIQRWQNFTGKEAIHEQSGKRYNEL
jgi:DNA modification methylase